MRRWMAKRRATWFEGKSCTSCGSQTDLELDHIDPSKKVDHKVWSWSDERRKRELAKCQVLCHDCHVIKTITNKERARGERIFGSKLTEQDVLQIRSLATEYSKAQLSREFGVDEKAIRAILLRQTWAHVK